MKRKLRILSLCISATLFHVYARGQSIYIPSDSTANSILTYTFSGGSFESYGCADLDPTFWLSGNGDTVSINFVNPQNNPAIRVWGMNDDDSAKIIVNSIDYPLLSANASYDDKKICNNILGSPGPDGVLFSFGLLVGANSNFLGNYSYQNVTLLNSNVKSISIVGQSGDGWGFAGVTISNPFSSTNLNQKSAESINIFPNPADDILNIALEKNDLTVDIEVLNLLGESVLKKENCVSKNFALDVSKLAKGAYIVSFRMKNSFVFKMINKI